MRASTKLPLCAVFCLASALAVSAEVYFEENFPDDSFESEWTYSEHPGKEFGKFVHSSGAFYNDVEADKGIQTSQDARFYALSKKFPPFSNEGKDLVIQYTVKHEQNIDCGGGYVKLFNCDLEPKKMHGETPYEIMFGPDICGPGTKKVHVIFSYNGKNLLINKDIRCRDDVYTHVYTLIVKSDNTYEVLIDNEKVESGELEADWDFLPPKKIKDPEAKKPEDWDEKPTIDDPTDEKPEDWDKPEHIPDPAATKPEDWDDEMDGEWEPAMIDNPDFKGEWKPKQIDNPNYKGVWVHPEIDNPEYKQDDKLYARKEICALGFDLWQVKSGTIFNNVLITDDIELAKEKADAIWKSRYEGEKKMKEALDEEERKKEEQEAKKSDDVQPDEGKSTPQKELPKANPTLNQNTEASLGYFEQKPQVIPAANMGVNSFSPLDNTAVFHFNSDQGSNSFGCSDFGWGDHCATTPEITSVFSEVDDVSFMENANPAKKLKPDSVNTASASGDESLFQMPYFETSWDTSSVEAFLNGDANQAGGNEVDLWSFSDLPAMMNGSF